MVDNYDLIVDAFNREKEKQINYLLESFTSEGMINDFFIMFFIVVMTHFFFFT